MSFCSASANASNGQPLNVYVLDIESIIGLPKISHVQEIFGNLDGNIISCQLNHLQIKFYNVINDFAKHIPPQSIIYILKKKIGYCFAKLRFQKCRWFWHCSCSDRILHFICSCSCDLTWLAVILLMLLLPCGFVGFVCSFTGFWFHFAYFVLFEAKTIYLFSVLIRGGFAYINFSTATTTTTIAKNVVFNYFGLFSQATSVFGSNDNASYTFEHHQAIPRKQCIYLCKNLCTVHTICNTNRQQPLGSNLLSFRFRWNSLLKISFFGSLVRVFIVIHFAEDVINECYCCYDYDYFHLKKEWWKEKLCRKQSCSCTWSCLLCSLEDHQKRMHE